jgi:indole-3-glycerol phosphate synthase
MTPIAAHTSDLLAAIVAATRHIVDVRSSQVSMAEMEKRASAVSARPGAFRQAVATPDAFNVIAECKRRSPSRGVLRADYDPVAIARSYQAHGAAAISVLTEPTFFDGSLDHLAAVRQAVSLPIIRKDFIIHPYQILEARAAGADAVLLIVAALSPAELTRLHLAAVEAELDVLVEVHGVDELPAALDAGARIIGVNHRNLRTLAVSTDLSERFTDRLPKNIVAVAESGLKTSADLLRLRKGGYQAFLVGERLMTSDDPGRALGELLGGCGVRNEQCS